MPSLIFPCAFCGHRMGVGRELAGRQVRCPHCKQVVRAPSVEHQVTTAAKAPHAEARKPAPPVDPPPPAPQPELPAPVVARLPDVQPPATTPHSPAAPRWAPFLHDPAAVASTPPPPPEMPPPVVAIPEHAPPQSGPETPRREGPEPAPSISARDDSPATPPVVHSPRALAPSPDESASEGSFSPTLAEPPRPSAALPRNAATAPPEIVPPATTAAAVAAREPAGSTGAVEPGSNWQWLATLHRVSPSNGAQPPSSAIRVEAAPGDVPPTEAPPPESQPSALDLLLKSLFPASVPQPAAPAPAPPTPREEPAVPTFGRREASDSILGDPEESEDEVFSSAPAVGRLIIPPFPEAMRPLPEHGSPQPHPEGEDRTATDNAKDAPPLPPPIEPVWTESVLPSDSAPAMLPSSSWDRPLPDVLAPEWPTEGASQPLFYEVTELPHAMLPPPPPLPQNPGASATVTAAFHWGAPPPAAAPPAAPTGAANNPWAGLEAAAAAAPAFAAWNAAAAPPASAAPAVQHLPTTPVAVAPEALAAIPLEPGPTEPIARPHASVRKATAHEEAPPRRGRGRLLFLLLLATYAAAATGAAVYAFFFHAAPAGVPSGGEVASPLGNIPDVIGEFPPAERRKVGSLKVPLNGPIPPELRVELKKKLRVGQLEVEPLRVSDLAPTIVQLQENQQQPTPFTYQTKSYVLRLGLKNASSDLWFYPTDPAFNRLLQEKEPKPGTGLEVGSKQYWGGLFRWPLAGTTYAKQYMVGQEADFELLGPGEYREVVIPASRSYGAEIREALRNFAGKALWRVQLRHGLTAVGGKEYPVSAVVGVEFRPDQIQSE